MRIGTATGLKILDFPGSTPGRSTHGRISSCIGAATRLENVVPDKTGWGSGPHFTAIGRLTGQGQLPLLGERSVKSLEFETSVFRNEL